MSHGNNHVVICGRFGGVTVNDARTLDVIHQLVTVPGRARIDALRVSSNLIALGQERESNHIHLLDTETWKVFGVCRGHNGIVRKLCSVGESFGGGIVGDGNPKSDFFCSASDGGTMRVWNPHTQKQVHEIRCGKSVSGVTDIPWRRWICGAHIQSNASAGIDCWDIETGVSAFHLPSPCTDGVWELGRTSEQYGLFVVPAQHCCRLYDPRAARTKGMVRSLKYPGWCKAINVADDIHLLVTADDAKTMRIWDLRKAESGCLHHFEAHPNNHATFWQNIARTDVDKFVSVTQSGTQRLVAFDTKAKVLGSSAKHKKRRSNSGVAYVGDRPWIRSCFASRDSIVEINERLSFMSDGVSCGGVSLLEVSIGGFRSVKAVAAFVKVQ